MVFFGIDIKKYIYQCEFKFGVRYETHFKNGKGGDGGVFSWYLELCLFVWIYVFVFMSKDTILNAQFLVRLQNFIWYICMCLIWMWFGCGVVVAIFKHFLNFSICFLLQFRSKAHFDWKLCWIFIKFTFKCEWNAYICVDRVKVGGGKKREKKFELLNGDFYLLFVCVIVVVFFFSFWFWLIFFLRIFTTKQIIIQK